MMKDKAKLDKKRKSTGKTETIKERAIYVYLPSHKMVDAWKERAEKAGVSISKFVIENVENSLRQEENNTYVSRSQLSDKIKSLEEENKKLAQENNMLSTLAEKLDNQLKDYRAAPFLDETFEGVRKYEQTLIKLLREKGFVRDDDILRVLKILPSNTKLVKAIWKQLENLEAYGLVEAGLGGWKWKE